MTVSMTFIFKAQIFSVIFTFLIFLSLSAFFLGNVNGDAPGIKVYTKPLNVEDSRLVYFEILEPPSLRYIYSARPARNFGTAFGPARSNAFDPTASKILVKLLGRITDSVINLSNQSYTSVELVVGDPSVGCSRLTNHHQIRGNSVLLIRGQCSFLTKALMAEQAGALFVIISDDDEGSTSTRIDMVHDESGRKVGIPAVFTSGKDGYMIRKEIGGDRRDNYAIVNIPVNLTSIPHHKRKHPPWNFIE